MFRATGVRLAESISKQPLNLREASAALLPPLPYVFRPWRPLPKLMSLVVVCTVEYCERIGTCHMKCARWGMTM